MSDFDEDLRSLLAIKTAHRTANPGCVDCGFLLHFIEKLWREYQATLARADAAPDKSASN
jgi:hypothetical protein